MLAPFHRCKEKGEKLSFYSNLHYTGYWNVLTFHDIHNFTFQFASVNSAISYSAMLIFTHQKHARFTLYFCTQYTSQLFLSFSISLFFIFYYFTLYLIPSLCSTRSMEYRMWNRMTALLRCPVWIYGLLKSIHLILVPMQSDNDSTANRQNW